MSSDINKQSITFVDNDINHTDIHSKRYAPHVIEST